MAKTVIITGAAGLVGSECVRLFYRGGYRVVGIDNDQRASMFGASTAQNASGLLVTCAGYVHFRDDIRDQHAMDKILQTHRGDVAAVIHCAAQPSHDYAATHIREDFEINTVGTLNLLEATRRYCPEAAFVFCSTNKVYGDAPNKVPMYQIEEHLRVEPAGEMPRRGLTCDGFSEQVPLDECTHSLFGCSKLAADLYVQEFGRYFGLNTVCFRAGCITGSAHAGAKLHGFLSYLVRCAVRGEPYTVIGYGGKQVRDNIHAADLAAAFWEYVQAPTPGAVFNIGGGRENSCSVLEAIAMVEEITGRKMQMSVEDEPRKGDHRWWITDTSKFRAAYPNWKITLGLRDIIEEIVKAEQLRAAA